MGCHASKEAAERQRAAILANESKEEEQMRTKQRQAEFKALKSEDGATQPGEFEALVAVFDNVDSQGDRIKSGAFDETLEAWRKSGDPIPIVLAHEWGDPWAHIGYALPEHVKAIPGRGLYVSKGILDIEDNPVARQVHRLMERRTLKEFSFGYRVPEGGERKAEDGAYDLNELQLIEFGPCLKGVNDSTELLAVKSLVDAERRRETGEEPTLDQRMDRLETLMLSVKGYADPPAESLVRQAVISRYVDDSNPDGVIEIEEILPDRVVYVVRTGDQTETYEVEYTIDSVGVVTLGATTQKAETEIETPAEAEEVETKTEETAEVIPEDTEPVQEEPETKTESEPSGPEDARAKSAEIDLMLRRQALDNLEAELGIPKEEEPVEVKSLDERLAEAEAEVAEPIAFDIGGVRLKQASDQLESYESGELREMLAKDQVVDDTQRSIEELEKELGGG